MQRRAKRPKARKCFGGFALQKLWLAQKPTRNPLKKPKDAKQGALLLDAISARMPHYPLDDAFRAELPAQLLPFFDAWRGRSSP
jgi:hypothetical protein